MARDPYARDDPTGILDWLSQKGERLGTLKPADAEAPRDYRFCPGCGRRLPMLKIRNRGQHCSPACRHRAFRKRHGLPSYEGPTHGRRRPKAGVGGPPPLCGASTII
jgi:hypothetical protein